jgi:hypothetical protein
VVDREKALKTPLFDLVFIDIDFLPGTRPSLRHVPVIKSSSDYRGAILYYNQGTDPERSDQLTTPDWSL